MHFSQLSDDTALSQIFILVTAVTCPEPENSTGVVMVLPELLEYQNSLSSSCAEGYLYEDGDYDRICEVDGEWSGNPLICKSKFVNMLVDCESMYLK